MQETNETKAETPKKAEKSMSFREIMDNFPKAGEILHNHGLHCIGCMMAQVESLEQGCKMHGLGDEDINKIIEEINNSDGEKETSTN